MSSGLLRYRSAPSNMFGDTCDDFLPVRPSSPDTETMFARFLSVPPTTTGVTTGPIPAPSHNRGYSAPNMLYQQMPSQSPVDIPYRVPMEMEQIKTEGVGDGDGGYNNFQNLIRHSSSPAGLFSQLDAENGFTAVRGLKHQLSFSPQITGWEYPSPISSSKRPREVEIEAKLLSGLNMQSELQSQDSVLCKMRAKRGCATHPRSIAERVRRTRISERMRKLQELVPNMDKQTNTSDMLDLAVEHIKDLQAQVKRLSESRASCTCCSSKRIRYSNPGV